MQQRNNDKTLIGEFVSKFVAKNKQKPLKILLFFILVCLFMWYFVDYPDFRLSHLIIAIVVCAGMFWLYLVEAKSKKEK